MSGAQSWSVKGIDPKVREAAREAAARQGVSLGEYLNQALANQSGGAPSTPAATPPTPRAPRQALSVRQELVEQEDWSVGAPRMSDPMRLTQRLESIERRTQLAVTGLDRAVSTIDRSVLGLAARIEEAEALSGEAAERVAEALDQFRLVGETLSGRLERAEQQAVESRRTLDGAHSELGGVRERLERQVSVAEEVARRAEAAASFLTAEMQTRDAAVAQTLSEARAVAEEAARQASEASADAVNELRRLQEQMSERLAESETSTRRAIETAITEVRSEASNETRGAREALLEEVVRLESEIARRVGTIDQLKAEHETLMARIEHAEAGARESTAGLRQAAGAAIADLRNAQLMLAARLKQVEDIAGTNPAIDLTALRHAQVDIAQRLASLEGKIEMSPVADALSAFERRLAGVEASGAEKLDQVDGAVKHVDQALQRLAERIAETESAANTAIRTLEETVSSLGARVEENRAAEETEAVRAMLEHRLDAMAQSVSQMVGEARSELAGQLQAALEGVANEGLESALTDVNRRLAAAERRQAQTIEAISLEIRRMSESVDKRLRAVEARNDDAAASAVREELSRMASTLEQRFDEIERREAAGFERMGLEVGRLSERLDERVGAVETRSAQAIEHVGEQVARMAERFNQRHETLSRELGERMTDSEERAGARVAEAISSIMQRLAEVEEHSQEAIAPVQKAVSSVASKLDRFESERGGEAAHDAAPAPSRFDDFPGFGSGLNDAEPQPYVSPRDAAQPVRAAPLKSRTATSEPTTGLSPDEADVYFAENTVDADDQRDRFTAPPAFDAIEAPPDDELLVDAASTDATEAPAPALDDDPFWSPEDDLDLSARDNEVRAADGDLFGALPAQSETADATPKVEPPPRKNDYLARARKAMQAQSLPWTRGGEASATPHLSLRGSSRVILWTAATAVTALLVGGAWYVKGDAATQQTAPENLAPTTTPAAAAADANAASSQSGALVARPLAPRNASLEQAAQAGDLTAQYELALQRIAAGRTPEGLTLLRRAAEHGFPMAQYRLAKLYERGQGVPADLTVARQWTERAAAAGNRRAMHDLGVYFARGEGAPLDEAAAFRWFRQAAELGVADSQYNLGVLYQQGRGVNASASEALFWFMVAARQGDRDAGARASTLESQLPPIQVQQARARAEAFHPRAASAAANGDFGARPWVVRPAT